MREADLAPLVRGVLPPLGWYVSGAGRQMRGARIKGYILVELATRGVPWIGVALVKRSAEAADNISAPSL